MVAPPVCLCENTVIRFKIFMRLASLALCAVALCPCFGKEVFYLTNGFSLQARSHTKEGDMLVLRTAMGTVALPKAEVESIESVPDVPAVTTAVSRSVTAASPDELLAQAANDQGLPPEFLRSVARIESGLRQNAISSKGAIGLMQLMPGTAAELGVEPTHQQDNAQGGAKYLRSLLIRFHGDSALALAAYNAGPGAVEKFGGVPPYAETRRYVQCVLDEYRRELNRGTNKPSATN